MEYGHSHKWPSCRFRDTWNCKWPRPTKMCMDVCYRCIGSMDNTTCVSFCFLHNESYIELVAKWKYRKERKWLELLFLNLAYIPAGVKSSLEKIQTILVPTALLKTYDTSKSLSLKDGSNGTNLKIVWPMVEEKSMIKKQFWMKIEYLRYTIPPSIHVRWPREMNETWKFMSWADKNMKFKPRTTQTLDAYDNEDQREHLKSNFQLGGHMIYQIVCFDETNRLVQKLDFSDQWWRRDLW